MSRADIMIKLKYALRFLPDKMYLKLYFYMTLKRKLDFDHPKTLNEKLQWLKFNDRTPLHSLVSDKYAVREYIKQELGEEYLVPLIGKWETAEEIDFDSLPQQYVLKCTHDSGGLVICRDKTSLDQDEAIKKLKKSLSRKFYYVGREWQYKNIKPLVICEELLLDQAGNTPADYKISCFNGKADNVMVCTGRFTKDGVKFYFFDRQWNFLPYNKGDEKLPADFTLPKPDNLEEMFQIADKLSKPFYYARIDLYNIDGKIYFSEITLCPNSGFDSDITYETDKLFGEKLHIPYGLSEK